MVDKFMGRQPLLSHCNDKEHKRNDMKVESFFEPKKAKANPSNVVENDTACDTLE